jgi:hypothetical protein
MLAGYLILSCLLPIQINTPIHPCSEPYTVKAIIDAAIIVGLPPSKAARKHALLSQLPETLSKESFQASEIVGLRKLFFRRYF